MKSLGYALWLLLPIELLALTYLSPVMGSWAHWTLAIATVALTLWAAMKLTFTWQVQRIFGVAFTVVGVFAIRRCQAIARRIRAKKEITEIVIPERPKVATRSIDLVRTHPRILNRGLTVVLGYGANRRPISIDMKSRHTLIAGSTGAGKSNLINSILIQLFSKRRNDVEIYLVDLKGNHEDALYKWGAVATYVRDPGPALELLEYLERSMRARNQSSKPYRTVLLIIDEVGDLTMGTVDRAIREEATRRLAILARKARSANIFMILATQHPRWDVVDKTIANNLLRKICLVVDTPQQAEVVFGFRPKGPLPKLAGEFILKDGIGDERGRALLVGSSESEEVILRRISNFKDPRLQLWKDVAAAKRVGDTVTGINRMYEAKRPQYDLDFVRYGYRHLHYAGVMDPPVKGGAFRIRISFLEGIPLIQQYIEAGKWTGAPNPVVKT